MFKKLLLMLALFIGAISYVQAQETTSDVQGRVMDGNNPIQGAVVTAIHLPTGTKYVTTTRKDGRYNLANMKIGGPYQITVTFLGYKTEQQDNVFLVLGQEFKADFSLTQTSNELKTIEVKGLRQDKVFNTGHTGSQEIISRAQIERLPTINRSLQDFTRLTPSANGLSFGGMNSSYNNITVDGANFNNAFGLSSVLGGQTNSQPISLDAIEQIQVNISPYDVRQGGFAGAGVNTVTRSGTNQVKGSVYTYIRTPGLQGYNVRTNTVPRPSYTYNLRGASIGAPIIENKLFIFVSAEQERISQPATTFVAAKPGQAPIPGVVSQAIADTLDALKNFLIQKYNYNPGNYQNYNYNTYSDKLTARLDWNVGKNSTFTLKYNYLKSYRDISASNSGAPNGNRQPSNTGLPFSGSGYRINNNFNIVIGELNTRFSNRVSNKLQIGYTALRDFRSSLSGADFPLVDILNGLGQSYTAFGYEPFTYNNVLNTNVFQFSDIVTVYKGNHEITLGTQNYIKRFKNGFSPNYAGAYQFNTLTDFYNSAMNGAPTAKNYTLSYALNKDGSFPFAQVGSNELGFFAQDKWRAKDNLTITYGLRFDLPIFTNSFTANPYASNLQFRDGKTYDVGHKPDNNLLISPRLGVNWDVFHDHKTQVRGGIGLFAGPPPFVWISNQASNNGVLFGSFFQQTKNPATGLPWVFSPNINAYRPSATSPNTSYNLVFTDPKFKYPQVMKLSGAVDQKLPGNIVATIEVTYSKDVNAVYFQNVNLPSTGTPLVGPDNRLRYSSPQIWSGAGGATVTNPNISSAILMANTNKGYAYTATAQFQRSVNNLTTSIAYTYSQAKNVNDGGSIAQSMWRDRPAHGDLNSDELGYAGYYQPHRVIGYAQYRFEYGKHYATSVGLVFEAATAGVGSYTYQGDLVNANTGGNSSLIYIPKTQSDIVLVPVNTGGGIITDTRTPDIIWNQLNNFIQQDPYMSKHRGQYAERNAVVLPWYKHVDLNVTQDFYVKSGKTKHTIRLTFDLINVGNFLNPNWGIAKTFNNTSFLKFEGIAQSGVNAGKPMFSFLYQDPKNQIPLVNSFQDNTSIFSRWQGQIGVRYLFN
jgi:hypothetical protein